MSRLLWLFGVCATSSFAAVSITTTSLPNGTVGVGYSATLGASGGTAPYTYTATGLPLFLFVFGDQIVGIPITAVTDANITLMVTDSANATATKNVKLTVMNPPLTVTTTTLPNGMVGSPYSATLAASGGTAPYTFSATGLPSGLSVNGSQITGTPGNALNAATVTLIVKDSATPVNTATENVSLTIASAPLSITTSSLPAGTVGSPYTATLAATGGTGAYTFSATGLPSTLSVTGSQITGTPTTPVTSASITLIVHDSAAPVNTATKNVSLTIAPAPLSVTTASLPNGTVGASYTATLGATGGTSPYTFSATGLPNGLSVNGNQITGTPTSAVNSASITLTVRDSATPANTATKNLSLTVSPAPLSITTTSLPNGAAGVPYTASLAATGGTSPYTFSASGLPNGLSVNGSQITGTPATAVTSASITLTAHDSATPANTATKSVSLTITGPSLSITTTSLPNGTVGTAYTATLGASGGTAPYTFSASGLPNGLSVNGNQIRGTPASAVGSANVTLMVSDSATPANTATKNVPLTISPAALSISTTNLPSGTVGTSYTAPLAATGGVAPYTFSASGLPNGLSVSGSQITGTPTSTVASASVTLMVSDSASPANTATKNVTLTIGPAALSISTTNLPSGTVGTAYTAALAATGGVAPYTFSASGLPNGLSVNGNQITGTPTAAVASANVTLTVSDSATPANTATKTVTLAIVPAALSIATPSLPNGTVDAPYTAALAATGGVAPYTFSASGLPNGLSVNGNQITGTPTNTVTAASVTLMVSDSATPANTATKTVALTISPAALSIATTSLPNGTVDTAYTATLGATGGIAPYTFSASGLPNGLSVNGNQITGTPTAAVTAAGITLTVTDSAAPANTVTRNVTLTIAPAALSISTTSLPNGTVGAPYTATVSASGGTAPYTFSATGLPSGLSINGNQITGTPTITVSSGVTLIVTDSATPANTATKSVALTIGPAALSIATTSLPNGTVGTAYSVNLGATGGVAPYTFSATGLPNGLAVSGNQITGTPTSTVSSASVTLAVSDSATPANTATRAVTLSVGPAAMNVSTTSLPNGTVGSSYSATLGASGGIAPYTFSVAGLPSGLFLAGNQITGTPTSVVTSASITVTATDSGTPPNSTSRNVTLSVGPAALIVTTMSLSSGTVGIPYAATLSATGGIPPYTFSAAGLPNGLSVSGNQIAGTPTSMVTGASVTIAVTDSASPAISATKTLALTIAAPPLVITTTSLPIGTMGAPYTAALAATGGIAPYTFSASGLPSGLAINGNQITGMPTSSVTGASVTLIVNDSAASANSVTRTLTLTIAAPPLTITTAGLPGGTIDVPYTASLAATGGIAPYTFSASGLPNGLAINGNQISGTPTSTVTGANITLTVSDSATPANTSTKTLPLTVGGPQLSLATTSLPTGFTGALYTAPLTATGGTAPYVFSATGLPSGLSVSGNQITGTPANVGSAAVTVMLSDSANPANTVSKSFSLTVSAGLAIGGCPAATALTGQAYSSTLSGSGGQPPYTWSISGQLAAGLAIDSRSGVISGTPAQSGTGSFTVTLADGSVSVSRPCSITVGQGLSITTSALLSGTVGASYSQQLGASGGTPPYTWSVATGSVPAGLSLTSSGQIAGTPTSTGAASFAVRVADNAGRSAAANFTLQVASSVSVAGCPALTAIAGQPYSGQFIASGGQPPYTWLVSSGVLPAGIRVNSTSGVVSGIAVDVGNYNYTIQALDRAGAAGTAACSLTVVGGLTITTASLPDATQRALYSQTLQSTGGQAPVVWSIAVGSLPPGLTLNASNGAIIGTPTQTGVFPFTAQASDANTTAVQKQFTINVAGGLVITACPASPAEIGFAYASSLNIAGGVPPYSFTFTGALPAGLSFDAVANAITGTPTQSGSFPFTIAIVDKNVATAKRDCTFDVRTAVRIVNDSLSAGTTGAPYLVTLSAAGGVPPYNWSSSAGALPPGLFLNAGTGQISGTPAIPGSYNLTARIVDTLGAQTTKDFTITITQGIAITDCPSPAAILGQSYSGSLVVAGGTAPYVWSIASGALPPGLTLLSDAAAINGTPNQPGVFTYMLQVNDAASKSTTRSCGIQVTSAGLSVTTNATLPAALAGTAYSQILDATGGNAPYSWTLVAGALPDGIVLDPTGKISGTASAIGSYQFTAQVTDQAGITVRQAFTLPVQAGTAPAARITGLPDIIAPAQQPVFDLQLDSAYPFAITGTIALTFTADSDVQADDPAVQFATGGRNLNFTIPANSTKVTFAAPIAALQTGTVAGTIQLTVKMQANGGDITPNPAPQRSIRVDRLAPKIISATVVKTASGFEIRLIGYSTTRDVSQGAFRFTSTGGTVTEVSVPLSGSAKDWFQSSASSPYGGQFSLVQPFSFQGAAPTLTSVSVTLTNGQGASAAVTANF